MKKTLTFLFIALIAGFTSCKKNDNNVRTFYAPPVKIGNGQARTFISLQGNSPLSIGIIMDASSLEGLQSKEDEYSYMLDLHPQSQLLGFDHCEIDWNPRGHDPLFAYGVPHFDFHFYKISREEQSQVVPGPDTVTVAPQYIPQDYVSGVMAVPDMGTHWSDTTAPEFNGQPFTATFIYGFYHGKMTFLEPMITKAFLETKPDFILPIKQPQAFQQHGYYPTKMHLSFDNKHQQYIISLEDLVYH